LSVIAKNVNVAIHILMMPNIVTSLGQNGIFKEQGNCRILIGM